MRSKSFMLLLIFVLFICPHHLYAKDQNKQDTINITGRFLPWSTSGLWIKYLEFKDGIVTSSKSKKKVGYHTSIVKSNEVVNWLKPSKMVYIKFDKPLFIEKGREPIIGILFPVSDINKKGSYMDILLEGGVVIGSLVSWYH